MLSSSAKELFILSLRTQLTSSECAGCNKRNFTFFKFFNCWLVMNHNLVDRRKRGGGGGDKGRLWYQYQIIRYQVPPKLKVLVSLILEE